MPARAFGVAAGLDPAVAGPLAARCQELGYESMWSNDTPMAKGLETLAEFAAVTNEPDLGVAVIAVDRLPNGMGLARSNGRRRRGDGRCRARDCVAPRNTNDTG